MGFFKSREERDEERREQKRLWELEVKQQEEEFKKQEDQEWQEEQEEYFKTIEPEVRRNNIVICYDTDDLSFKQAAMNYLLQRGYVCVQNAVTFTQYSTDYVLTFVKKEFADTFIVK